MTSYLTATKPITVVVVEDDSSARQRLVRAISEAADMQLLAEFACGRDALYFLEQHAPAVLLCDLGLPDLPGLAIITYCVERHPQCDVMVVTMYEDRKHVLRSLEAGARGYLLKDALGDEILEKIRELAAGGAPLTPAVARMVLERMRPATTRPPVDGATLAGGLTTKELMVLTRIAQGFSYAEIADLEGVTRNTVATHVRGIYSKLAVHSKNEAVFEASRLGLLDLGM